MKFRDVLMGIHKLARARQKAATDLATSGHMWRYKFADQTKATSFTAHDFARRFHPLFLSTTPSSARLEACFDDLIRLRSLLLAEVG